MATEALKAAAIKNLDASPVVPITSASGYLCCWTDSTSSTPGMAAGSTYRLARIPTNARLKRLLFSCATHGGSSAFDIDVGYSTSTTDGTQISLQGGIVQIGSGDNKLFSVSAVSQLKNSEVTFNNFTSAHKNLPLWQVLINLGTTDFAADPKGFFDLMLKSTATDTSGGVLELTVHYVT